MWKALHYFICKAFYFIALLSRCETTISNSCNSYKFVQQIIYMASIFSKIISGEISSYKIAENEKFYAFLDIFPSAYGHTLVVPKIEVDRLFDLPTAYLDGMLTFAQPIAKAIQQAFGCDRVNIVTIGFEVPHAHIHLLPMNGMSDMNALSKKMKVTPEELKAVQEKIIAHLH